MCESKKFTSIVNLGKHPLVNRLVEKKNLKQKDLSSENRQSKHDVHGNVIPRA